MPSYPCYCHAFAGALLFLAVGCDRTVYEIELTPRGDRIERKLVVSRTGGKSGEEQLAREASRIASLYPSTFQPEDEGKRGFFGVFQQKMPADVQGYGTYAHLTSPLGSMSFYVERFRGQDDQVARFERRQKAVNVFARLALGWCKQEFGKKPFFGKLRDFVEKDLSRDLLNLSLYSCPIGGPVTMPDSEEIVREALVRPGVGDAPTVSLPDEAAATSADLHVRLAQYLLERDYFTLGELPRVVRAVEADDHDAISRLLAEILARKIGVRIDDSFVDVVADAKRLEASWNKYLTATPEYKKLLADFKKEQAHNPQPNAPSPQPFWIKASTRRRKRRSSRVSAQDDPLPN